jgi:hypothetical protein
MKITAKDIEEERRIPDRSEVKAVLDQYFVGPITEEIVTNLTDYVVRVMQDKPLHWGEMDKFQLRNRRAFGKAWREDLAYDRDYRRSIDLAAWLASSTEGYPAPKPYCPDLYIGTWKYQDPEHRTHGSSAATGDSTPTHPGARTAFAGVFTGKAGLIRRRRLLPRK